MALRPLTEQERSAAREKAKASRQVRAEAKKKLKNREVGIAEFLRSAEGDEALERIRVEDLLRSLPGIGEIRAASIMEHLGIAPSRRLRGLGVHQRAHLISYLEG